ncbi:multicopper oxidase family protein [Nocardia sp. CDC160]|uniref:multicopper oxidase family protein n=1 Tax=Nocardia sp. CDC160 TaxID=3112166 RepID=UPI002DBF4EFA|nr:multicopper oxidase domain-containing protein [Nocardia sp. CDC160]MEC3920252.1 multicopper oxidase domain-containing protein [Nocardia sp. CDC160]
MSGRLTRRRVLGLAAIAAAAGAGLTWELSGARQVGEMARSELALPEPFTLPGTIPAVLEPQRQDSTTDYYQLTQLRAHVQIIPGHLTEIWGYNGLFPGPTLKATRGRTAVVTHRNELPEPTVVHLHGGHTPAEYDGYPTDLLYPEGSPAPTMDPDDPQARITQGSRDYVYPHQQPAATLWYHDHRMGHTGATVWRGLAGFHLIGDDIEDSLGLPREDYDLPLLLCDRSFGSDGSFLYSGMEPGHHSQGMLGDVVLVNGVPWPLYSVAAARYRLRWLNASNARVYRLVLHGTHREAPNFIQIGSDGGLLGAPQHLDAFDIAPGERIDTVLDLSGYRVGDELTVVNDLGTGSTVPVLRLRITRTVTDTSRIPDRLADVEQIDTRTATHRSFDFRQDRARDAWLINGRPFDPLLVDADVKLGQVEIWRLTTNFNHPVHVHLDQFQVLSRNRRPPRPTDLGRKDTLNLGASEEAEIAIRFGDYTGRYLIHCHNLEHEDMAMMATLVTHR